MKPIKFHELDWRNNKLVMLFCILTLIFIPLSLFDVWDFLGEKTVKLITAVCYLGLALNHLYPFFYRNHVQWNKGGIVIRVNSFWGFNFSFADVKRIEYAEDRYTVYKYSNGWKPKVINLKGIDQESKERLLEILRHHVLSPVREENA